ncbi:MULTISPECIES: ParB N-terminal domain-containing protein [unclassified Breznakia]|uniref:ParB/RepB/Spo0J family partition protein n=1 Tax=unclassified Breznakia TaxID=2623764 RepID=UPI0024737A00|nr:MULTISPECIES: ParB N-terminal domain-containing protein [unclassified Breznakia]MDH6367056.1 hypothetical protein [Breznakia sp. PH1-1]MDH6404172.1 hypothetical protein [Breznakia sp. PF1-11]MDH6411943.1 hypothetical protein [Breznakia sp. PFB1-11]MDH6414160.1 hypothetical protein [Breznakia sp. PFB1-14]MDH6418913.1 hypothetical protein [Breznakia sp. PFB1-12]
MGVNSNLTRKNKSSGVDQLLQTNVTVKSEMKSSDDIILIDFRDIDFNDLNAVAEFDSTELIKDLAENILEIGQQEIIVVYKNEFNRYTLISGERRTRAVAYYYGKDSTLSPLLKARVVKKPMDRLTEEETILSFNESRKLTEEQLIELVRSYLSLFDKLKEAGRKPKGQLRDWVAMKLQIGQKRAEKYIHIIQGKKTIEDFAPKPKDTDNSKEPAESELWQRIAEKILRNATGCKCTVKSSYLKIDFNDKDTLTEIFSTFGLDEVEEY